MKFFIDTHAHLNDEKLYPNIETIIKNALEENVKRIFCVGYDLNSSKLAVSIAQNFEVVYSIVGIHPNSINEIDRIDEIEEIIEDEKVIAIGEIGLDFYWNKFDKRIQIDGFIKQLEIAQKYELPIVLHLRDVKGSFEVFNIALDILKHFNLKNVVFHSFSGNEEIAQKILERNYFISFSPMITYKNSHMQKILKITNLNNVFFETDSPYLAPAGLGKIINEPKNVKIVYEKACEITGLTIEEITEKAYENVNRCFKLKERELRRLFDWVYDNESLTENLNDEEAKAFYKRLEKFIEEEYENGYLISQIKRKILDEKEKI